jgi:hypothetical protein
VPAVPILLVDRYAGVRAALRGLLAGTADVVAEAGTLAGLRAHLGAAPRDAVVVTGLVLPDGDAADVIALGRPTIVATWLPPDEREVDLAGALAVVGTPVGAGLVAALRAHPPPGAAPRS